MPSYSVHKSTSVPGTFGPNEIHLITDPSNANFLSVYVSNAAGTAFRRTPNQADIQALVTAASGATVSVVADIAARDALTPATGNEAWVQDASADATVDAGAAKYVYDGTAWAKVAEAESQDITLDWASIEGRPNATASAIDAAVLASHSHANKTQLDKVGEDANGNFQYNGTDYVKGGTDAW